MPVQAQLAQRLPNLIIGGVSKAGTTSLFSYLAQHPDVCPSDLKELRYFSSLRNGERPGELEEYASHFRHANGERYRLEATPGYFYGGGVIARAMRETCPGVRVLVSLRSPQERCWSWFRFVKSRTRIPRKMTFDDYLDRCWELNCKGVDGRVEHQPFWGLGGGCYDAYLDEWIAELGDRFRVIFFEDLASDPRQTVKGLCEWLDVEGGAVDGFDYRIENKTKLYRNRQIQRAAVRINRRSERFFRRHAVLKRAMRGAYHAVNEPAREDVMSPAAAARLDAFFGPHNARLATQLAGIGVSLPQSWNGLRRSQQPSDSMAS